LLAVAGVVGAAHAEQLDQAHAVGLFLRASGLSRVGFYVTAPEEASFLTHHRHSCGGRLAMYNKFIGGIPIVVGVLVRERSQGGKERTQGTGTSAPQRRH
jgi:hypothetical protein